MSQNHSVILSTILLLAAMTYFSGCAAQRETVTLPVDAPGSFSQTGTPQLPERWWTSFEDEKLNTMIDTALTTNFGLKTAWQRLRASQAVVNRESSALFPDLEATAQGEVTDGATSGPPGENIGLGLSSVYEVDLWGRIRSSVEAEEFRAEASFTDYQAAALSLSAEIVNTWYRLVEAHSQRSLVEQQIETNRQVLELLENRLGTGQIQGVDIIRQRQLLESTIEQRTYAEADIQVLEHQLAVLLGRSPQAQQVTVPDSLPELPPLPDTGIPTNLVRQRPDVQSAFYRLQAADRDLASAISNQYPRLTLSASVSTAADNAGNLFEDWALSFAGNLVAPLLYGGELSAEVDRVEAVKQQRLYEYGQTVLTAFREVEDALVLEQQQSESIDHIEEQVTLARDAYEQLRLQYLNGTSNYLDVLTALDEVQQLRRDLISARLARIEYRIGLYRALAGSFETARESGN
ncbi:efflux transporter outer membrane subunit [Halalkalibaculum sp. DA3122]|uniref:efflux transporter outer membrane subunit n=1 Tax=unclassified Halalkalibaculum TaxID=2964617 RepID=UPI003753F270